MAQVFGAPSTECLSLSATHSAPLAVWHTQRLSRTAATCVRTQAWTSRDLDTLTVPASQPSRARVGRVQAAPLVVPAAHAHREDGQHATAAPAPLGSATLSTQCRRGVLPAVGSSSKLAAYGGLDAAPAPSGPWPGRNGGCRCSWRVGTGAGCTGARQRPQATVLAAGRRGRA